MNRILIGITTVMAVSIITIVSVYAQVEQTGIASFYHDSLEGNRTANGEVFFQNRLTAAHKTLPFDTWVMVTDGSGSSIVVRINDRLPARSARTIDLTTFAARQLDMIQAGLKRVRVRVITPQLAWQWYLESGYYYGPIALSTP